MPDCVPLDPSARPSVASRPSHRRWGLLGLTALVVVAGGVSDPARAQIGLDERRLVGRVGFVNTVLTPPTVLVESRTGDGEVEAISAGRDPVLRNSAPLFLDPDLPPWQVRHEVVVEAFGGDYVMSADAFLDETDQSYAFGRAHPRSIHDAEFTNAWAPNLQEVTADHPDPIEGVDVLECGQWLRIEFVEADPARPGELRPTTQPMLGGSVFVNARLDPAEDSPPYSYARRRAGGTRSPLTRRSFPAGVTSVDVWTRASRNLEPGLPDVLQQVELEFSQDCTLQNPTCPGESGGLARLLFFQGAQAPVAGSAPAHVPSAAGGDPGVFVPCDRAEPVRLLVLVEPCAPPCPIPPAELAGCVAMIGETEHSRGDPRTHVRFHDGSTSVATPGVTNFGQPPHPDASLSLFDAHDPDDSEGDWTLGGLPPDRDGALEAIFELVVPDDPDGFIRFDTDEIPVTTPGSGERRLGPDFCMVPGIWTGEIVLRDAGGGGRSLGVMSALDQRASRIFSQGGRGGSARELRPGDVGADGAFRMDYENFVATAEHARATWQQNGLLTCFAEPSSTDSRFVDGCVQTTWVRPNHRVEWDPFDFIARGAGGNWDGPLMPGTSIAERDARRIRADYELCFARLRISIESRETRFFDPRITRWGSSFRDDAGTPELEDDVWYWTRNNLRDFEGTPRIRTQAATRGFVNLVLPQGSYTEIGGRIRTILSESPLRIGVTALPEIDVTLGCGSSCGVVPRPEGGEPLITLCLDPLLTCNDPDVLDGSFTVEGRIFHDRPITAAWWSANDGPEHPIDPADAGASDCFGCEDELSILIDDEDGEIGACTNTLAIGFVDDEDHEAVALIELRLDSEPPLLTEWDDPHAPPLDCAERRFLCEGDVLPSPGAIDDCSSLGDPTSPLVVTYEGPDEPLPAGEHVVRWTATDACGNESTCEQLVVVGAGGSLEIECPEPLRLECEGPDGVPADDPRIVAWLEAASVTDGCGGEPELVHDAPDVFTGGCEPGVTTIVTWTATAPDGMEVSCSSSVTVVDTMSPSLEVPAPLVLGCDGSDGVAADDPRIVEWLESATASDSCGEPELAHDAPALFPVSCEGGTTTVTWTARDACGFEVQASSSVTVVDAEPPAFDVQPSLGGSGCAFLWPPQHGYVVLSLEDTGAVASDDCGEVELRFAGCASSQPEDAHGAENAAGGGDGHSECDCAISPDGRRVALRAERNGGCAPLDRVYTLTLEAVDACGLTTESEPFSLCVYHDRGHRPPATGPVFSANPGSHQPDDLCAEEGWSNGTYPEPGGPGTEPHCGPGCSPACDPTQQDGPPRARP